MTDLDAILAENHAPAARGSLSARILAAAESAEPANDTQSRRPWWSLGGIAAMAIMATLFVFQPTAETTAEWEQLADGSGFSELYEWVEGEDLGQ